MRVFKRTILIVIPLAIILPTLLFVLSFFTGYDIHKNVSYGEGAQNVLDIYIPKEAYEREENGFVLFIHGGSWMGGDKEEEALRCRILASRGYIAASMNYTLFSEENAESYTVFSVLDEIDASLSKVKSFAAERGIHVDKAATAGYSAGAHLAMLYAYSRAESAPLEIVFTASMAGPADISPEIWGEDMAKRIGTILTGKEITSEMLESGEGVALLSSVSPTAFIGENAPPSLITQGGKDNIVPPANADSLIEKFTAFSVPYDYVYLKRSDHSLLQNPFGHLSYYKLLLKYARAYF